MPPQPPNGARPAPRLSPAEAQFASALRMLKAATDNMALAFDSLIESRSPQLADPAPPADPNAVPLRERVGGRAVFGAAALRATEAGERLHEEAGAADSLSTDSDAASSSAVPNPST